MAVVLPVLGVVIFGNGSVGCEVGCREGSSEEGETGAPQQMYS